MQCPVCKNVHLQMSERQGIEIDYCPQCRGVWLDRGELDKIIERSHPASTANDASFQQRPANPPLPAHPQQGHYRKKREGFLADLFDFD